MTILNDNDDPAEVIKRLEEHKKATAAKREELDMVKAQLAIAERAYRQATAQKNRLVDSLTADVRLERELEKQAAAALRQKEAQEKRDKLLRDYEKKSAELDDLIKDLPWHNGFEKDGELLKIKNFQVDGAKRLAVAQKGILGDKRGLGKTITGIAFLDLVQAKKVLIIAPNDVVPQFEEEVVTWARHRKIISFRGLDKDARLVIYPLLKMLDRFVVTINYEAWRRDKSVIDDLVDAGIDTLVIDEAHRAKSSTKITARGIFQIAFTPNYCPKCNLVGHIATDDTRWVQGKALVDTDWEQAFYCKNCGTRLKPSVENILSMTGTPIINKPQELFTMLHLRDPFVFPDERTFLSDYCYSVAANRWRFHPGGLERITTKMNEFFIQRTRDDVGIEIPPPDIKIHYLDRDPINYPQQYQAYKELTTKAALSFGDDPDQKINMLYILEVILRERQLITWPAGIQLNIKDQNPDSDTFGEIIDVVRIDVHESQKLDAVQELVEELCEEGERTIAFSKFKGPVYELQRRVGRKYNTTTATGDDSTQHRTQVRYDFDLKTAPEHPRWTTVFATYDAFSTGINLNAARHVILIDDEWSPGMEDQAIGRIDRLNSTDQAQVHIFRVRNTIDDFMESLIEEKRKLTEGFETKIGAKDMLGHLRAVK